jgi:hypothetical protein
VRARLLTFIAIEGSPARPGTTMGPPDLATEETLFGMRVRPRASEYAQTLWRPRFGEVRAWTDYVAPNAGRAYTVDQCRTAIVTVPMAGDLLLLDLEVSGSDDGLILATKDAFDSASRITLDGREPLQAAGVFAGSLGRADLRRQVLLLPGGPSAKFAGDPTALTAAQAGLLRQLVFKDVDITYRPDLAPVSVPIDMNGPDRQAVFVWDTNTVVEGLDGYAHLVGLRTLGIAMSNAQVLGALKRCTEIREEAARAIADPADAGNAAPAEARRVHLEGRLRRIGALRQELGVGVEMHALATTVAGGRPVRRYHETVVAESPLPDLLLVTEHLLGQLGDSVRLEKDLLDVAESREAARKQIAIASATRGLLDQSEAFKAASLVFAAVAGVISLAGLFAAMASIPGRVDESLLGSTSAVVLFVLGALFVAAVIGIGLRRASRVHLGRGWRLALGPIRLALLTLLIGSVTYSLRGALDGRGATAHIGIGVALAGLALTAMIFTFALQLDFDPPVDPAHLTEPDPVETPPATALTEPAMVRVPSQPTGTDQPADAPATS